MPVEPGTIDWSTVPAPWQYSEPNGVPTTIGRLDYPPSVYTSENLEMIERRDGQELRGAATAQMYADALQELRAWATENNLVLRTRRHRAVNGGLSEYIYSWIVQQNIAPNQGGHYLHNMLLEGEVGSHESCIRCVLIGLSLNSEGKCPLCDGIVECVHCQSPIEGTPQYIVEDQILCNYCYQDSVCSGCEQHSISRLHGEECQVCAERLQEAIANLNIQELPADELPTDPLIASLPERPFKTITIETEMDGRGRQIGQMLHACGYLATPHMNSYSAIAHPSEAPAFYKSDSSVSGGELVIPYLELDDQEHVEMLTGLLTTLKGLQGQGIARLSTACGGHIHMSAKGMGFNDVWRLATIYNYLEKPLYYIAGAGSPNGHRSIGINDEEDEYGETMEHDYAAPIVKGPFNTLTNFGKHFNNQGRNCGLNLANFFAGARNCACGASLVGKIEECTCVIDKFTIEWRLWDATFNPRIIQAWVVLMQAITAYAQITDFVTEAEEAQFPPFAWDRRPFAAASESDVMALKERLAWMHTKLPLTRNERDSINYACKQSMLVGLGDEYLDSLMELENESNLTAKPIRERNPRRIRRGNAPDMPTPEAPPVPSGLTNFVEAARINLSDVQRTSVNEWAATTGSTILGDEVPLPDPFNNS